MHTVWNVDCSRTFRAGLAPDAPSYVSHKHQECNWPERRPSFAVLALINPQHQTLILPNLEWSCLIWIRIVVVLIPKARSNTSDNHNNFDLKLNGWLFSHSLNMFVLVLGLGWHWSWHAHTNHASQARLFLRFPNVQSMSKPLWHKILYPFNPFQQCCISLTKAVKNLKDPWEFSRSLPTYNYTIAARFNFCIQIWRISKQHLE